MDDFSVHLNADDDLDPSTQEALGEMVKAAYKAIINGTLPRKGNRTMGEKKDWRNAGPQITREREELRAIIDAIPEAMPMALIKAEIYDSMKPFVANDPMISYIAKISRKEAVGLLGEIRWLKQCRDRK